MKNVFWIGLILIIPFNGFGQKVEKDTVESFKPVSKVATRLAIVPGFGQIYNRDYWKVPIVYLSLGGAIYSYHLNSLKYNDFLKAYKTFYNADGSIKSDVTTDSKALVRVRNLFNTSSDSLKLSRDVIEKQKNYWRRSRNLSVIVTGAIYALSIIESNVAAHLKTFDLSDDLTLRIEPKISQPLVKQPAPGLRFVINFK